MFCKPKTRAIIYKLLDTFELTIWSGNQILLLYNSKIQYVSFIVQVVIICVSIKNLIESLE